jgi:hypothetical protein
MDPEAVDREYAALQQQAQQTVALVQTLAGKLATASGAGDSNAREWQLDLKEIALAIRDEENTATALLQAIHAVVDSHVQTVAPQPAAYQPPPPPNQPPPPPYQPPNLYPQPPAYQQPVNYAPEPQYQSGGYGQNTGGTLHHFLGSTFGRAIVTGAGFGIGDDIINDIFR